MKVTTQKVENLALNALELKAAELIAQDQEVDAIFMLDDQLEVDTSRAPIAAMLAKSAGADFYQGVFEKIARYHELGYPDAYSRGQPRGQAESKKQTQKAYQALHPPPSYKKSTKESVDQFKKAR